VFSQEREGCLRSLAGWEPALKAAAESTSSAKKKREGTGMPEPNSALPKTTDLL